MEREDLLTALATFVGEAQPVCVETLSDERSTLNASDDLTPASELLTIYRRRAAIADESALLDRMGRQSS